MDDEQLLKMQSELLKSLQPGRPLHVEHVNCPSCNRKVDVEVGVVPEGLSIVCNSCECEFLIEKHPQ